MRKMRRRYFLLGGAGALGALVVGWTAAPVRSRLLPDRPLRTDPDRVALNGWVAVGVDNHVTVFMSQAEMGQGSHTGLAMLLVDEMDADWARVRLQQAGADAIYNNQSSIVAALPWFQPDDHGVVQQMTAHVVRKILRAIPGLSGTGGSSSITDQWQPLREAGASARAMLIAAAAARWKVPRHDCHAKDGYVLCGPERRASFGELAKEAAQLPVPNQVRLKEPSQFNLIGKSVRRLDNAPKLRGAATYAIDTVKPALRYASIAMCPTLGGKVKRVDFKGAESLPGVRKVVTLDPVPAGLGGTGSTSGGVAVIADTPWQASRALEEVSIEWDPGAAQGVSSLAVRAELTEALDRQRGKVHFQHGDTGVALNSAAITVTADYHVPFLAHATMEPMNCTAQFKDDVLTVWAATQAVGFTRRAISDALKIDGAKINIQVPYLGGGFGRRYFSDVCVQAARLAMESGGDPVQLIWSREQDMAHDYYRPAYAARCKAGLDREGRLTAWETMSVGSSMGAPALLDGTTDGASNTAYAFPTARIAHHTIESPVSVGIWRSVNHTQNAFFTESFVDECAFATGQDPVAFRGALLKDNDRHMRVLRRVAALANWSQPLPAGAEGAKRGRGMAIHRAFDSVVAQVAEVSVSPAGEIRVHHVLCVIDCGIAVNPNLVRQQMEGAIVFGLSAALHGEITIDRGQVQQSNFHDYAPLRMAECPDIQVDIIPSDAPPGGVGEPGTPPIAPAVANAVFAATGQRLRTLPLRFSWANSGDAHEHS
jgi:isoquinoline 1-oxidoreductase beta subunit